MDFNILKMFNLLICEMKIKTTLRYRFSAITLAKIQKLGHSFCWGSCKETSTHPLLEGIQNGTASGKMSMPFDSIILFLRINPEDTPPTTQKYTCRGCFITALFVTAKILEIT